MAVSNIKEAKVIKEGKGREEARSGKGKVEQAIL